jgi:hypothetical protein
VVKRVHGLLRAGRRPPTVHLLDPGPLQRMASSQVAHVLAERCSTVVWLKAAAIYMQYLPPAHSQTNFVSGRVQARPSETIDLTGDSDEEDVLITGSSAPAQQNSWHWVAPTKLPTTLPQPALAGSPPRKRLAKCPVCLEEVKDAACGPCG